MLTHQSIGVGASKFLGLQRIFDQIFPNLPKKISCKFCRPVLWCDLQKTVFTCFSANLGRHFSKSNNVGRHFCSNFQGFCPNFQRFCPNFQGFCPDFQQIKTFWGTLAPPPPTPLHQKRDLLVLFGASFFCPNLVFCSMFKALSKRPDYEKLKSTCDNLGAVYSSDVGGKQLNEKILDCKMLVSSCATYNCRVLKS